MTTPFSTVATVSSSLDHWSRLPGRLPAVRRAVSPFWKRVMSVELRLSWPTGPVDSSGSPVDSSGPSVEGSGAVLSPGVKAQVTVHTALA